MKLNCAEPWPSRNWVETNALEVAEVEDQLVSAQTISHTLQKVGLHGLQGSLFWSWLTKKSCKQFAEDNLAKSMDYWNHVLWSDESKVHLFDSDGVQHVWRCPGEEYKNEESFKGLLHPQNENPKYIKLCSEDELTNF